MEDAALCPRFALRLPYGVGTVRRRMACGATADVIGYGPMFDALHQDITDFHDYDHRLATPTGSTPEGEQRSSRRCAAPRKARACSRSIGVALRSNYQHLRDRRRAPASDRWPASSAAKTSAAAGRP